MRIRWYMLFSNWIFVGSLLYLVGLHSISTFPANLIALPFGLYFVWQKREVDPLWKLFYAAFIHLAPFIWVPWVVNMENLTWAIFAFMLYLMYLFVNRLSMDDIYTSTLNEVHTSFLSYLTERIGVKLI